MEWRDWKTVIAAVAAASAIGYLYFEAEASWGAFAQTPLAAWLPGFIGSHLGAISLKDVIITFSFFAFFFLWWLFDHLLSCLIQLVLWVGLLFVVILLVRMIF